MHIGQIRQGDVLLMPVEGITPPISAVAKTEIILAVGELTGHAHRLRAGAVMEWGVQGQRYVRVLSREAGTLSHEDHDPTPAAVVAPEVTYQIVPQKEWDLSGQWRRIRD